MHILLYNSSRTRTTSSPSKRPTSWWPRFTHRRAHAILAGSRALAQSAWRHLEVPARRVAPASEFYTRRAEGFISEGKPPTTQDGYALAACPSSCRRTHFCKDGVTPPHSACKQKQSVVWWLVTPREAGEQRPNNHARNVSNSKHDTKYRPTILLPRLFQANHKSKPTFLWGQHTSHN